MLDQAATLGAQTVMTGQGSDQVAMLLPYYLYRYLAAGPLADGLAGVGPAIGELFAATIVGGTQPRPDLFPAYGFADGVTLLVASGAHRRSGNAVFDRAWDPPSSRRFGLWPRAVPSIATRRCRPLAVSMGIEAVELNVGDASPLGTGGADCSRTPPS